MLCVVYLRSDGDDGQMDKVVELVTAASSVEAEKGTVASYDERWKKWR